MLIFQIRISACKQRGYKENLLVTKRPDSWCGRTMCSSICLLISIVLVSGCGFSFSPGVEMVEVHGWVRLDGEPISGARVAFVPDTNELTATDYAISYGVTNDQGRFELKLADGTVGALAGRHRVFITRSSLSTEGPEIESDNLSDFPPIEGGELARNNGLAWNPLQEQILSAPDETIPFYYNSRSELTLQINSGQGTQQLEFDLSSIDPFLK